MADVAFRRQELTDAKVQVEQAVEAAKDAVYDEKPIKAEIQVGIAQRGIQRWKRAEQRLNAALSEVAEAVPYA